MTDKEIIKALECCSEPCVECDECPLYCTGANCSSFELHRYALALINRQQAEIFKLQAKIQALEMDNKQLDCDIFNALMNLEAKQAEIERLKGYNENLQSANTALSNEILDIKSETVKEFAERLKKEIDIRPTYSREQNKYVFFLIDNLVKEMVGEG